MAEALTVLDAYGQHGGLRIQERLRRGIATPKTLLVNLQRHSKTVHERAVGMTECVQTAALDL